MNTQARMRLPTATQLPPTAVLIPRTSTLLEPGPSNKWTKCKVDGRRCTRSIEVCFPENLVGPSQKLKKNNLRGKCSLSKTKKNDVGQIHFGFLSYLKTWWVQVKQWKVVNWRRFPSLKDLVGQGPSHNRRTIPSETSGRWIHSLEGMVSSQFKKWKSKSPFK